MTWLSAVGFAGALLILAAYLQVSRGKWAGKSMVFQVTNLVGATCLTWYSLAIAAYPTVLLNGVWLIVALVALWQLGRARSKS